LKRCDRPDEVVSMELATQHNPAQATHNHWVVNRQHLGSNRAVRVVSWQTTPHKYLTTNNSNYSDLRSTNIATFSQHHSNDTASND
jgi:hypothetical protein